MKKPVLIAFMLLAAACCMWAHSPLLYVEDNYDGTIDVEGGFSNGASASGMPVLIVEDKPYRGREKSFEGKKVLFETVFDEIGCVELIKPDVDGYIVVFNGGPGHTISMKGPALEDYEREEWLAVIEERSAELGVWKELFLGER
jgi:hypothetical protein